MAALDSRLGRWASGFITAMWLAAGTVGGQELPVQPGGGAALILLQAEPDKGAAAAGVHSFGGEVVAKEGVGYVSAQSDRVTVARKGFGAWSASFRYAIGSGVGAGDYTFWARWMQGGDPEQCAQTFKVLAGPDADHLEERGTFALINYVPWKMGWVNATKSLALKESDRVIEVRNSGRGQDAKVFDAFLLVPGAPPAPKPAEKQVGQVTISGQNEKRGPLELPVQGTAQRPQILLELGSAAPSSASESLVVCAGEVAEHEGDRGIEVKKDEVSSLRAGPGKWGVNFRFKLAEGHPAGDYTFWARWKQGGDPKVSAQTFEVWAGGGESKLEKRAAMNLTPGGWNYVWRDGKTVAIKPDDTVLEVRNVGNGQTAKIFSAFLLGGPKPPPPPVELPVSPTADRPVVVLSCGTQPLRPPGEVPHGILLVGKLVGKEGADAASMGKTETFVRRKGFGEWGAAFQYELPQPVPAGYYGFQARYLSGGEVSQVRQTFAVLAGPDENSLGLRGTFQTVNRTPFQHQWVAGKGTLTIFPGDRILRVVNTGKAHDVKIFSAFVMPLERPLADWITAERGKLRSAFLAMGKKAEKPERWLYVLDGEGPDQVLFEGLTQEAARGWYEQAQVQYLIGPEADEIAARLNITSRPAAFIADSDSRVLGVLANPHSAAQAAQFLNDPGKVGVLPAYPEEEGSPAPLQNGSPANWLVASGWPGRCGVGHLGLDAEAVQRPNVGDPIIYGFYTAGNRTTRWESRPVGEKNLCHILDKLPESYAWGRGTSYAVAYLQVEKQMRAVLHLQHSGVESAVFLDGVAQPLRADAAPAFALPRRQVDHEGVVQRGGQETHDDTATAQEPQGPLATVLQLDKGWHCLVLKLVHRQAKDETVFFSAQLAGEDGKPAANIRSQVNDPTTAKGMARAAARLWPLITLENVPGNLPRPGEPLTLVADLRANMAKFSPLFAGPFLPLSATLRVRVSDYDGRELRRVETTGVFPGIVKLDLGTAPAAGYYALIPELYAADGRLIRRYAPDGFTVVLGNIEQKARLDKKELMESWYYAFNDWETFAPWLERIGLFKNVGSIPGVSAKDTPAKWEDAQRRGIVLFGDFAGDSAWMNNSEPDAKKVVDLATKYTCFFKSVNEIDGRWHGGEARAWEATRKPEKWVERAKWQYEAVHAARPDAFYVGGSLYCSGVNRAAEPPLLGPRAWFQKCLELGWDNYIDAWDVHCYPQNPPRLEAPSVSNSSNESDLGVLSVYKELGRTNTKPFLLGETASLVWHGFTGMRWQADTLTKMVAWTNSRPDWLGIALCASHLDRRVTLAEYNMARNPGEAAVYTAGALIDGLPYRRHPADDKEIQAAWFGETFLIWRADDKDGEWTMPLDDGQRWLIVDVVGRARPLGVENGKAKFTIGTSPLYVLRQSEYERLTRLP